MATETYTLSVEIVGKIEGLENAMSRASKSIGNAADHFSSIGRSLAPITAGVVALGAKTGKTAIDFLSLKENAQAAFTQLLGSGEKATKMMDDLYAFAKTTPFKYDTYLKSAQSLMAMGTSAKDVIPYLEGITNAAIGTGKGTEGVEQLTTAFSKMSARGKISLEELNMVMEAGVPATKILANQYGVTTDEMYKMISSGELMASDVLPKLVQGMNEGTDGAAGMTAAYGGMAEAYKNTLSGSIDSMTSKFRNMSIQMWDAENAYPALIKVIQSFTNALDLLPIVFKSVANAAAPALETIANGLDRFTAYMQNLDPAQVQRLGSAILGLAAGGAVFMGLGAALRQLQLWIEATRWAVGGLRAAILTIPQIPAAINGSLDTLRLRAMYAKDALLGLNVSGIFGRLSQSLKMATSGMRVFARTTAAAAAPFLPLILTLGALAAVIAYLWKTDEKFKSSMIQAGSEIKAAFIPVAQALAQAFADIAKAVAPVITTLAGQLAPIITQVAGIISEVIIAIMPTIVSLIQSIANVLQQIAPAITTILSLVGSAITTIVQLVTPIITFIAGVITNVIQLISPILTFIAGIMSRIIAVIMPIITIVIGVLTSIWNAVSPVVTRIFSFIKTTFGRIGGVIRGLVSIVSTVFNRIRTIVVTVFSAIQGAWRKLTGVVTAIAEGIGGAFEKLIGHVKGLINGFIGHVNSAIGIINKIPKVNIPKIPKLARGTDNWAGGFAVMNEGGRGEIVHLPNGAQVIPHDISVKYAKEAARTNASGGYMDTEALTAAVITGIAQMSGPLGDSLKEAVAGMGIEVNGREFGRVIQQYS